MIGIVVVDDVVVIRSLRGVRGRWYRAVRESGRGVLEVDRERLTVAAEPYSGPSPAVDDAYRRKYGDDAGVRAMVAPDAVRATLQLTPA